MRKPPKLGKEDNLNIMISDIFCLFKLFVMDLIFFYLFINDF